MKQFEESGKKAENSKDVKKYLSDDKSSNWMYESSSSDVPNTSNTNSRNDASVQKPPGSTTSETQPEKESKFLKAAEKCIGLSRTTERWVRSIRKQHENVSKVGNEARASYENVPTPVQVAVNHTVKKHTYGTMNFRRAINIGEQVASSAVDVTAKVVERTGTIASDTAYYLRWAEQRSRAVKKTSSDVQWKQDQNNPYVYRGDVKPPQRN